MVSTHPTSLSFDNCTAPPGSQVQLLLDVQRMRMKLRGDRAFSVAASRLWNWLPLHIRQASSLYIFKSFLKTHCLEMNKNTQE